MWNSVVSTYFCRTEGLPSLKQRPVRGLGALWRMHPGGYKKEHSMDSSPCPVYELIAVVVSSLAMACQHFQSLVQIFENLLPVAKRSLVCSHWSHAVRTATSWLVLPPFGVSPKRGSKGEPVVAHPGQLSSPIQPPSH